MRFVVGLVGLALVGGCGTKASCAYCGQAFSDAQCQAFAEESDCESGVAVEDPICGAGTMGCEFSGCGTGPVTCDVGDTDGT